MTGARLRKLLLALLLAGCWDDTAIPTVCLVPLELSLSAAFPAYQFSLVGRYVADGTSVMKTASCPGTFSGGSCDENGISLRDFDNTAVILDLTIIAGPDTVFDGELPVEPAPSCSSAAREVAVEL